MTGATEVNTGATTTLKATVKPSAKVTYKSDNTEVATVDAKTGVVTGVKAGTATITATAKANGKTVKATKKITVVDANTLEITDLQAKTASSLVATLAAPLSETAKVEVTRAGVSTPVSGDVKAEGTTVTFSTTANLTAGTYTMTITDGDKTASKTVTVQDEYVKEIVVTSTQALTNAEAIDNGGPVAGAEAYIYYDVLNQYGESLRNSTTINWTTSAGTPKVDKATGKLTVVNGNGSQPFTYGSEIYLTGVYTKNGVSYNGSVKVGLAQALDSVEAKGFVNINEPTKLLTTIPTNFTKNTYRMVYATYDQDKNLLPASTTNKNDGKVTFISDAPLLLKSDFTDGEIFVIDGIEYSSLKIEPGDYVDKGGEVNITAISNKTGTKKVTNFVIGSGALLESLTLQAPTDIVANGDTNVVIPYVAKDTNGNTVENYETIVRSSNNLKLNATRGTLSVIQTDDGKAAILWDDTDDHAGTYEDSDGVDIPVSLITVVVGGTSNNQTIDLKDTRIPVAIKSIDINNNADALVAGDKQTVDFYSTQVTYVDQYNDEMPGDDAAKFFRYAYTDKYGQGTEKAYYAVKADFTDAKTYFNDADQVITYGHTLSIEANDGDKVVNDTVKYSIVSNTKSINANDANWSVAGKVKNIQYTIVPVEKLNNIGFASISKQQLDSGLMKYANGDTAGLKVKNGKLVDAFDKDNVAAGKKIKTKGTVSVSGNYNGKTLSVPAELYSVANDVFTVSNDGKLDAVSGGAISYSELYDVNSAKLTRKDATKVLKGTVINKIGNSTENVANISTKVVVSDAPSVVTTMKLAENAVVWATNTAYTFKDDDQFKLKNSDAILFVYDQYEQELDTSDVDLAFKVSDTVENTGDFAHKLNSLGIQNNGSYGANLVGAELGDTLTLTVEATDKNDSSVTVSKVCKIKVGSDEYAYIQNDSDRADKTLRSTLGISYLQ